MTPEERWQKIENTLETVAERQAEFEQNMLRAEKRLEGVERRQDWLDRRVRLFARAGLRAVVLNREAHARNEERYARIDAMLEQQAFRNAEMQDKLNALIDIEQRRQPPQQ